MSTDLVRAPEASLERRTAAATLQGRMALIVEVMATTLEQGKDYGRIPGTDKPTLFKPGAEKLCLVFSLAAAQPTIDAFTSDEEIRYRVHVPIENASGRVLAVGIGEASTGEEKYKWRRPVCDEEFEETPLELRREKWFKGKNNGPNWKGKQIRTVPTDLANTVLKMAHKRAYIHATLLATGASSVFNQDLEDFTKELREAVVEAEQERKATAPVRRASETGRTAAASPPAASPPLHISEPRSVHAVSDQRDTNNKPYWVIVLSGDPHTYRTRNHAMAESIRKCIGAAIRLSYRTSEWQGTTYYNVENFTAEPAATTEAAPPLAATDIPFDR